MINFRIFITAIIIAYSANACAETYERQDLCKSYRYNFASEEKQKVGEHIAKLFNSKRGEVLLSFKLNDWYIIYTNTHDSDEAFVFFNSPPLTSNTYVTEWGGGAGKDETNEIRNWVLKNAKGIPVELADCFAWYVTQAREM